jgi:hypothetical protein
MQAERKRTTEQIVSQVQETLNSYLKTNLGVEFVSYDEESVIYRANGDTKHIITAVYFLENNADQFRVQCIDFPLLNSNHASVTFHAHCKDRAYLYN